MMSLQSMTSQSNAASQLLQTSAERLASGKKVNSASDNAASIAIIERLEAQGRQFDASIANANNGIGMLDVADAATAGINDGLQRLRELAVQSANGILTDEDRQGLNAEANQIKSEISRITQDTEFNGQKVLSKNAALNIQLGKDAASSTVIRTKDLASQLDNNGLQSLDFSSQASSQTAINALDDMIATTTKARSDFGSQANRLAASVASLQDQKLSAAQSQSQIQDADFAKESANFLAADLKEKVSFAMQAQANTNAGQVLALLGK